MEKDEEQARMEAANEAMKKDALRAANAEKDKLKNEVAEQKRIALSAFCSEFFELRMSSDVY